MQLNVCFHITEKLDMQVFNFYIICFDFISSSIKRSICTKLKGIAQTKRFVECSMLIINLAAWEYAAALTSISGSIDRHPLISINFI